MQVSQERPHGKLVPNVGFIRRVKLLRDPFCLKEISPFAGPSPGFPDTTWRRGCPHYLHPPSSMIGRDRSWISFK